MTPASGWGARRIGLFASGSLLAGLGIGLTVSGTVPLGPTVLLVGAAASGTALWLPGAAQVTSRPPAAVSHDASGELVTVVVCARDESRFIDACLDSVLSQSHGRLQCVVVDDGSTDRTLDQVLDRVGGDDRFTIVSNDLPLGLAAARNQGLGRARGRWITFLDGDDLLFPESIGARLAAAESHGERDPWSAGAYCDWLPVPEDHSPSSPPAPRALGDVEWLSALDDAPFIASAPLLSTSVVRSLGGFDEDAPTAEDAILWNRLLRHGYTLGYAPTVGVAYRQKAGSMFRGTALRHAGIISEIVESNYRPMSEPAAPGAPHPYRDPAGHYLAVVTRFRRTVMAYAIALGDDDPKAIEAAGSAVAAASAPYLRTALDLGDLAALAAWRTASIGAPGFDEAALAARLGGELDALVPRRAALGPIDGPVAVDRFGRTAHRVQPLRATGPIGGEVTIVPSAAYHSDEAGPLAHALARRGIRAEIAVPEAFAATVLPALARYVPEVPVFDPAYVELQGEVVVVFDDWGTETRPMVDRGKASGITTVAKVEGVQDFADDDVGRRRDAYRTVAVVLGQGRNDADALPDRDVRIVGSSRLERIWLQPPRMPGPPLAVLNVNFTWGVLEEARELWVESAADGCRRIGMPYVLSLHPVERDRYQGRHPVADQPMRHLLTQASVLISRFSTVPFEAMARGVPFVYHNPHGEKVPTFQDPGGAFDISDDVPSLVAALDESRRFVSTYRDRAAPFFLDQIDVDPATPPEERAADVIAGLLRSR